MDTNQYKVLTTLAYVEKDLNAPRRLAVMLRKHGPVGYSQFIHKQINKIVPTLQLIHTFAKNS